MAFHQRKIKRLPSHPVGMDTFPGPWIPATSMDGGSAEEDMESSPPIRAGMTMHLSTFRPSPMFLLI
ncbi:hypothetical protein [Methyloglobulus sp.]|uniref:hypothetical protein n=1 Tax=Methyloglobulus sp. TaxID=2518622 RepID=UPI0039898164